MKKTPSQPVPDSGSPILNGPYSEPAFHYATAEDGSLDYEDARPGRRIFAPQTPQVPISRKPQASLYDLNDFAAEYRDKLENLLGGQAGQWRSLGLLARLFESHKTTLGMTPNNRHNAGDFVLIPFPFTDLSDQKVCPALLSTSPDSDGTYIAAGHVSHPVPFAKGKKLAVRVISQFGEECTKVLTL